jgi:hypothetical protein
MSQLNLVQYDFRPDGSEPQIVKPEPDILKGLNKPDEFDYDKFIDVMRTAASTYQILKDRRGVKHERVIFNAGQSKKASVLEGVTSLSGARRNPGNMLETGIAATLEPGTAFDYITPDGNTPSGPYRLKDLWYLAIRGRYTIGLGTDDEPYAAIDSLKDIVELYYDHQIDLPTHVRGTAEGARLALGLKTAFGDIKGTVLDGIDGISPAANYTKTRIAQDIVSRWNRRADASDTPGAISPLHLKEVKRLMPAIYHGPYKYAHVAPLPAVLHPLEFAKAALMNFVGFKHNNDLNNLDQHAVFQDLRASIFRNDSPTLMMFGSKSAIHTQEDCIDFTQKLISSLPEDIRTKNRLLRVLIHIDASHDQNTDDTLIRPAIERYGFPDIMHMMSLIIGGLSEEIELNIPAKVNIDSKQA